MHKFVRNLITEWRQLELPFKDAIVIVAVSGGADSTSLLLALADLKKRKKLDLEIIAAHFNHKLRGKESRTSDQHFVRDLANELGFKFVSEKGSLKGNSDLEQRARDERYAFLLKAAKKKVQFVLTAHTMNDQAETVLMNLIRGSGVDGLGGMPKIRLLSPKSDIKLVRPLLGWAKRNDTEDFCRELNIKPRHDSMNNDLKFTRVRLRKAILPLLAEINPKIIESLARTGEFLRSDRATQFDAKVDETLRIVDLEKLGTTELNSHIRAWIKENRGSLRGLELKHIAAVGSLAKSRKSGRIVEIPGGGQVVKSGGRLAFRQIKLEN